MSDFSDSSENPENLFLQNLMDLLQIQPSSTADDPNPLLSSLKGLLFEPASNYDNFDSRNKSPLAKEESKLEKEIIGIILSGKTDSLKPNSRQAVLIGEHHVCVGFQVETGLGGSDFRVWEWHGHIMLFDVENGYSPEYIYGNYFEKIQVGSH